VLSRLRPDALVRRDDEQHHVRTAETGERIVHKALMAGHVDEPDLNVAGAKTGESEIDRDPAGLLFSEPIAVGSRQRPDHTGLAVIDVPGGRGNKSMADHVDASD
jgi:hypothetical protein